MGLRSFLMGTQQLQSGLGEYAKGEESIRQRAAKDAFLNEQPNLIRKYQETQDPIEKARVGAEYVKGTINAGVYKEDPYAEVIAKSLLSKGDEVKPGTQVLPESAIAALQSGNASEIRKETAKLKDPKAQQFMLAQAGIEARSGRNYGLSTEKTTTAQQTKAYENLNKTEDAFREQDFKIKEIQQALKSNTSLGDNIAFGYIARSVAQEKGPLSDQDIARIQGITGFQGTANEFKARFSGDTYSKLSPEQKKAIEGIISNNAQNFQAKKAETLAADLNGLYQSQSRLKDSDGNPTGILKQRLDQYKKQGIPVTFDKENKSFVVGKPAKTVTGNMTSLINSASAIKDPIVKQQFLNAIQKRAGEDISEEQMNQMMKKIKDAGGA